MKYFTLSISLIFSLFAHGQEKKDTSGGKVFVYVEQMPKADFDMGEYLSKTLKYPKEARYKDIEGRVIVKFIVTETGEIDSAYVIKGIGGGCDEAALEAIRNMPRWQPGMQNGKFVKVYFTQPIIFHLEDRGRKKKHPKAPVQ